MEDEFFVAVFEGAGFFVPGACPLACFAAACRLKYVISIYLMLPVEAYEYRVRGAAHGEDCADNRVRR